MFLYEDFQRICAEYHCLKILSHAQISVQYKEVLCQGLMFWATMDDYNRG